MTVPRWVHVEGQRALDGYGLGDRRHRPRCTRCDGSLSEADKLTLYAYRPPDRFELAPARRYCDDCTTDALLEPTVGLFEVLATVTVQFEPPEFVCREVDVRDFSVPVEDRYRTTLTL
jgi:hypothetical protein